MNMGEVERRAQGAGTGAERRHGRRTQARARARAQTSDNLEVINVLLK